MFEQPRRTRETQCSRLVGLLGQATGTTVLAIACLVTLLSVGLTPHFRVHSSGVIVVTGASSGIGEHAASTLAASTGYTVFAGVRKQADADRLQTTYPGLRTVFLDVTSEESIAAAVEVVTINTSEPLVALVNNAGVQSDLPIELQAREPRRAQSKRTLVTNCVSIHSPTDKRGGPVYLWRQCTRDPQCDQSVPPGPTQDWRWRAHRQRRFAIWRDREPWLGHLQCEQVCD